MKSDHSFIEFNVNNYAWVKLTEYGRQCLRDNHERLKAAYGGKLKLGYTPPEEDEDGWSRWQAWSLMQELGQHCSLGIDPPFETTIRVEVDNQEDIHCCPLCGARRNDWGVSAIFSGDEFYSSRRRKRK